MVAATGAIQIATIASQQFGSKGGAAAFSVPSGTIAAGSSEAGGSGGYSMKDIGSGVTAFDGVNTEKSAAALNELAKSAASASLALGDISDLYKSGKKSFSSEGIGENIATWGALLMSGAKYSSEVEGRLKKDGFIDAIREVWVDNAALLNQAAASMGITAVDGIKERIDGLDWKNFIGVWETMSASGAGAGMNSAMSQFMTKFASELGGGDLYKFGKGGESDADTLIRMASDLNAFNQAIAPLNQSLEGKGSAITVQRIINTVGDLDKVKEGVSGFLDSVYTDSERKTYEAQSALRRIQDKELEINKKNWGQGFVMPETRPEFKSTVMGLISNPTEANMSIFSSLMQVLLWALMEVAQDGNVEAILHGWRELAREERWWLYAKGAAPGQKTGSGWRLALFHALSEAPDSRSAETVTQEKKSPGNGSRSTRKAAPKKQLESGKSSQSQQDQQTSNNNLSQPKPAKPALCRKPSQSQPPNSVENLPEKKGKKTMKGTADK